MRKVKCPDGTTRFVHKDPNKAFPLGFADRSSEIQAEIAGLDAVTADVSATTQRSYSALLFAIDKSNNTLQANYAASYIVYAASPCTGHQKFSDAVGVLQKANTDLAQLMIKVELVKHMILGDEDPLRIRAAILAAFEVLDPPEVRETRHLVAEAGENVARWDEQG